MGYKLRDCVTCVTAMTKFFAIPYDSGYRNVRMGAGPSRIARELGARIVRAVTAA